MTTNWPAAPSGTNWPDLDRLVGLVQPVLESECRPRGVHQVRWDPLQRTRVAYEDGNGSVAVVEATPDTVVRSLLTDDVALPGVEEVLDPQRLARRLEPLLGRQLRDCVTATVSYRPGSRCVVRCDVTDESGRRSIFIKLLSGGAQAYAESHHTLAATDAGHSLVPSLLCHWPDLAAVVTAAERGPTASALLGDPSTPAEDRVRLATSIGGLLARIHRATPGPHAVGTVHTATDELADLARYLPAARHADATVALSLGWALDHLGSAAPDGGRPVFSHGSFRPGQVIVNDGGMTVLDLDGAGLSDPERDLGNAMAYLDWQHLRRGGAAEPILSGAVQRGYAAAGGDADHDRLDWWHAAALLKIGGRRYRSLDTAHWAAVPSLIGAASALLERRGTRRVESGGYLRRDRLPDLTDAARMSSLLQDQLSGDGRGTARITAVQTLRVAAGRRVVMRYTVAGTSEEPVEIIAKAFVEPERAGITHENLVLFDALRDPAVPCGTQVPMGVNQALGVVVYRSAGGQPMTELTGTSAAQAGEAARHLGTWLRTVHATASGARRRLDVAHEAANAALWADQLGRVDDRLRVPARELARRLTACSADLPQVIDSLIHKDLHLAHVLVQDGSPSTVIDLDEARMGDPAFDVAHLCAYADEVPEVAVQLAMPFLEAYGPVAGPDAGSRLAFFRAYTLLKITRQAVRGQAGEDVVQAGVARLDRGVACLPG